MHSRCTWRSQRTPVVRGQCCPRGAGPSRDEQQRLRGAGVCESPPTSPAAPSKPCTASGGQGLGFPNPSPNPAAPGAAIRWAPDSSNGAGWGCLCDLALQHANIMRGRVLPRQLWNPIEMPFGNRASFAAVLFCRRTRLADLLQPAGVPSTTGNCIWHCTLQRSAREIRFQNRSSCSLYCKQVRRKAADRRELVQTEH